MPWGGGHLNSVILFPTTYNNITSDMARQEHLNPLQSNNIQKYTFQNSSFVRQFLKGVNNKTAAE